MREMQFFCSLVLETWSLNSFEGIKLEESFEALSVWLVFKNPLCRGCGLSIPTKTHVGISFPVRAIKRVSLEVRTGSIHRLMGLLFIIMQCTTQLQNPSESSSSRRTTPDIAFKICFH